MYSFRSKVRYSEIDKDGKLSLEAHMNYFQDCSSFHSESLGVGIDFLKEKHLTWMLLGWHVQIFRRPTMGEEITIGTWPHSFKNIRGGRNFVFNYGLRFGMCDFCNFGCFGLAAIGTYALL